MEKRVLVYIFLALALTAPVLWAANPSALAKPEGEVILTVSGEITNTNTDRGEAEFDIAMLDALPQTSFETTTIWTSGKQEFSGVSLKTLLDAVGANGKRVNAAAVDDYAIDLPMTDAVDDGALLAYRVGGEEISVREKGPIWVVYPFDDHIEYQTEVYYARSIWQLVHMEVLKD